MSHENNPRSIKFYVKRFIEKRRAEFKDKTVLDLPAGNGVTSKWLKDIGANPVPMDLFPEYFKQDNLTCQRADITQGIPAADSSMDYVISQEGIEHFTDQFHAMKEFNRTLKIGGTLIVTTPNYSNLHSKWSYLLSESEKHTSQMPPNEIDSVWMNHQDASDGVYFGHVFLIGVQKMRVLARLSGFELVGVHPTRMKSSCVPLLIFYPLIWLSNFLAMKKHLKMDKGYSSEVKKKVYEEQFRLNTSLAVLTHGHLFLEFKKTLESQDVMRQFKSVHQGFGET